MQWHRKHYYLFSQIDNKLFPGVTQSLLIPETFFFQWLVTIDQYDSNVCVFKLVQSKRAVPD